MTAGIASMPLSMIRQEETRKAVTELGLPWSWKHFAEGYEKKGGAGDSSLLLFKEGMSFKAAGASG